MANKYLERTHSIEKSTSTEKEEFWRGIRPMGGNNARSRVLRAVA